MMLFEEVALYYDKLESVTSRLAMIDILSEMLGKAGKAEIRPLIYLTQGLLGPPFEGLQLGIAEKFAQQAIASATGFSNGEVEANAKKTGDLGNTAEELTKKSRMKRISQRKHTVIDIYETLLKIASTSGHGSQEAKIHTLVSLLSFASPIEARYIIRLALGNVRLGAGDATIIEALSKMATGDRASKSKLENAYNICSDLGKVGEILADNGMRGIEKIRVSLFNPIRPALAERLPTSEEILEKMHGKCAVESKYDGLRAQVHIDRKRKKAEIFSRNLERLTAMLPEIAAAAMEEIKAENAIIEGEAIAYNEETKEFRPFQETIQRKRKHGIDELSVSMPLHLFAFDLMYCEGEDYLEKPYRERREKLESIIKGGKTILVSDRIIVDNPRALDKYFEEQVSEGLEGVVAKELNSPYVAGARKYSWIKLKRSYKGELSDTVDVVIIGYYLGRGSRAEFQFGGLLAAVFNDKRDMFETITRIGTGFTEEQMKNFKKILDKIKRPAKPARVDSLIEPDFWVEPRYVVTVRADEITKSPMHTCGREGETGYALRFPRIVSDGVRADKSPEDATTTKEIVEMYGMQKRIKVADS
ncbi:MAG: ATP-dependent DNA ligase [Candidatus Micrarchaeaceae archaeon]